MSAVSDNALKVRLEFKQGQSDMEKAEAGLQAFAHTAQALFFLGAGEVSIGQAIFDGEDASAQPIFDALLRAYELGREHGKEQIREAARASPSQPETGYVSPETT